MKKLSLKNFIKFTISVFIIFWLPNLLFHFLIEYTGIKPFSWIETLKETPCKWYRRLTLQDEMTIAFNDYPNSAYYGIFILVFFIGFLIYSIIKPGWDKVFYLFFLSILCGPLWFLWTGNLGFIGG